jgi:hypothetical protein
MFDVPICLSIGLFALVLCERHSTAQERRETVAKVDKFVTVYGSRIHYVEAGSGAPLILIHAAVLQFLSDVK